MSDLDAIQARLDAAGANVLIVPSGAGVQLIVGPGGRKGVTLGSISLDLRTDQPLIDLWNHAHADLVALVAELRAARELRAAIDKHDDDSSEPICACIRKAAADYDKVTGEGS